MGNFDQSHFIINQKNFNQTIADLKPFISKTFPNAEKPQRQLDFSGDFFDQIEQIDDELFELGNNFVQPYI